MNIYCGEKRAHVTKKDSYFVRVVKETPCKLLNLLGPRSTPVQSLTVWTKLWCIHRFFKIDRVT